MGRISRGIARTRQLSAVRPGRVSAIGINVEVLEVMLAPSTSSAAASSTEQDLRPRARAWSWLASLSLAGGDIRAAEGYLLELLAWCAFADREPQVDDNIDDEL